MFVRSCVYFPLLAVRWQPAFFFSLIRHYICFPPACILTFDSDLFSFIAEEDDKFELESVSDDEEEGDLGLESHHGRASHFNDSRAHDGGSTIFGGTGYSGKSGRSESRDSEGGVPGTEVGDLFSLCTLLVLLLCKI